MAIMAIFDEPPPRKKTYLLRMTEQEHARLREAASKQGFKDIAEFIRTAVNHFDKHHKPPKK